MANATFEVTSEDLSEREVLSTLTVITATPNDASTYTCRAENIVGSVGETINLMVHGELLSSSVHSVGT